MEKFVFAGALILGSAIAVPQILDRTLQQNSPGVEANGGKRAVQQMQSVSVDARRDNPLDGRKVRIEMDRGGHFFADARMNGYRTDVLIDTGATLVAINQSTARRMGIRLKDSDFKHKVNTANGTADVAKAVIDEIVIGRIRIEDVPATVTRDKALNVTLLGMSFLRKLRRFEISGNELLLIQ